MSNFACIGLVGDPEVLQDHMDAWLDGAQPGPGASRYWVDAGGATLAFHLKQRALECLTPFFSAPAPTVWAVRSTAPTIDEECRHCSGVDVDLLDAAGEMVTRATVQLVAFAPYEKWLTGERRWTVEVVAFAGELETYPDETSFAAAERELQLAANAFLPVGMFGPVSPVGDRATAVLVGRVIEAAERRNESTGGAFVHLVVDTLPGRLNVVAPAQPLPTPGSIVEVQAWLVGRPTDPPPVRQR